MDINKFKTRFEGAAWANPSNLIPISIGGLGSIGSWTSLFLARTQIFELFLIDFDEVDEENIAGQFFAPSQKDDVKTKALKENISIFCGKDDNIYTSISDISLIKSVSYVCVSAFDNMEARKVMFKKWKDLVFDEKFTSREISPIFIDGRLNAEKIQVFFVLPEGAVRYEETLLNDSEIPDDVCSYKYTTHFSSMIASRITQGLLNHITNCLVKDSIYEVPYMVEEEGPLFITEIKTY